MISMFEIMKLVPQVCTVLEKLLERVPKEEWMEKYHSPQGLRVRIVIENTEMIAQIRDITPTTIPEESPDRGDR